MHAITACLLEGGLVKGFKITPGWRKLALIDRESLNSSSDADLNAPADGVLPFGELTWENFERLCYRLASRAARVEHVARYGRSGQAQQGIDLFARTPNGKYEVWQAKRYGSIASSDVKAMVDTFRAGTWKDKSEQLIIAVQASLADTKVQDEIESQAKTLKAEGITFVPRGGEELSELLRSHPELVDDFFGRGWVEAFLGPEAAQALRARLDGAEYARVRAQLRRFYDASFHLLDVGVALPLAPDGAAQDAPPSLLRRFALPDVFVRDTITDEQRGPRPHESEQRSDASAEPAVVNGDTGFTPVPAITRCSCSTSSVIWNAAHCVPATSTVPMAGTVRSSRSWRATRARSRASIFGPMRPLQCQKSTST